MKSQIKIYFDDQVSQLMTDVISQLGLSSQNYNLGIPSHDQHDKAQVSILVCENWDESFQQFAKDQEGVLKAIFITNDDQANLPSEFINLVYFIKSLSHEHSCKIICNTYLLLGQFLQSNDAQEERFEFLGNQLNSLVNQLESELEQSEQHFYTHKHQARLEHRNLSLRKSYRIGIEEGGEYLGSIDAQDGILLWSFASDDYALLSLLTSFSINFKSCFYQSDKKRILPDVTLFKDQLQEYLAEQSRSLKKESLEYSFLFLQLDYATMEMSIHSLSDYKIFPSSKSEELTSHQQQRISLLPGEKVMIFSPGIMKNYKSLKSSQSFESYIDSFDTEYSEALFDEVVFSLKKDLSSRFYKYDQCGLYIEVNKNVIKQV